MNSDFYNTAFTTLEKSKIISTAISTPDPDIVGINGGNDTVDKVFLLSADEVLKYFPYDGESISEGRILSPTPYSISSGVFLNETTGGCWWGTRTPGFEQYKNQNVTPNGALDGSMMASREQIAVRPAIWITL